MGYESVEYENLLILKMALGRMAKDTPVGMKIFDENEEHGFSRERIEHELNRVRAELPHFDLEINEDERAQSEIDRVKSMLK